MRSRINEKKMLQNILYYDSLLLLIAYLDSGPDPRVQKLLDHGDSVVVVI
jgi:hypothetical protein